MIRGISHNVALKLPLRTIITALDQFIVISRNFWTWMTNENPFSSPHHSGPECASAHSVASVVDVGRAKRRADANIHSIPQKPNAPGRSNPFDLHSARIGFGVEAMKQKKPILWLLLLPFLVPIFVFCVSRMQDAKITNYNVGGFKDGQSGERAAIKKLAEVIQNEGVSGKTRVGWSVTILAPKSRKGTSLFSVEFERYHKRFTKYASHSSNTNPLQVVATQYENVDDDSIYQVASLSGLTPDLVKYGAVVKKHGIVDLDPQGRPIR